MKLPQEFDMTITRAEFARLLPAAVGHVAFREHGDAYSGGVPVRSAAGADEPRWRIEVRALPALRLGSVALERQRVRIEFFGYTPKQIDAFMAHFELYFRRGGG